jgi:hypothetical protein
MSSVLPLIAKCAMSGAPGFGDHSLLLMNDGQAGVDQDVGIEFPICKLLIFPVPKSLRTAAVGVSL